MDVQYLASLFSSFLVAVETFAMVHDATRSLLWSMGLALVSFCGAFTFFFAVAHHRELVLVRFFLLKRCARTAKRKARLRHPQRVPAFREVGRERREFP